MLIILAGLLASGKTTIARALGRRIAAMHIRIDTIEQALRTADALNGNAAAGYLVGYGIAADNLALGTIVLADSVNPVAASRQAWRDVGTAAGVRTVEIEIVCSDPEEHRRRVETRTSDLPGLVKPTWQDVMNRHYERWERQPWVIDTAGTDCAAIVDGLIDRLGLA